MRVGQYERYFNQNSNKSANFTKTPQNHSLRKSFQGYPAVTWDRRTNISQERNRRIFLQPFIAKVPNMNSSVATSINSNTLNIGTILNNNHKEFTALEHVTPKGGYFFKDFNF
jgi:hypothetical protein